MSPKGGAILGPRVMIWTILVEIHKIYIKAQGLVVPKKIFKHFPKFDLFIAHVTYLCNGPEPFEHSW